MFRLGGAAESSLSCSLEERLTAGVRGRPLFARGSWGDGMEIDFLQLRGRVESLERVLETELRVALRVCADLLGPGGAPRAEAAVWPPALGEALQEPFGNEALPKPSLLASAAGSEKMMSQLHSEVLKYVASHDHKLDAHLQHALEHRVDLERTVDQWREEMTRRLDERLDGHLQQSRVLRSGFEDGLAQLREAVERRCRALELRAAEQQGAEVQSQQRLTDQGQAVRDIEEKLGRLSEKCASMEPVCERLLKYKADLEDSMAKDCEKSAAELNELQKYFIAKIDDVKSGLEASVLELQKESRQQMLSLSTQASDIAAKSIMSLEARIQEVAAKADASPEESRKRAEGMGAALRMEFQAEFEALKKKLDCYALEAKGRSASLAKQLNGQSDEARSAADLGRSATLAAERAVAASERAERRLQDLQERSDAESELQRRQAERAALEAVGTLERDVAGVRALIEGQRERTSTQVAELRRQLVVATEEMRGISTGQITGEVKQQVGAATLKASEDIADLKLQMEARLQDISSRLDTFAETHRQHTEGHAAELRAEAASTATSTKKQLECLDISVRGNVSSVLQQVQHVAEELRVVKERGREATTCAEQAITTAERAEAAIAKEDAARCLRLQQQEESFRAAAETARENFRRECAAASEVNRLPPKWLVAAEERVKSLEGLRKDYNDASETIRSWRDAAEKRLKAVEEAQLTANARPAAAQTPAVEASALDALGKRIDSLAEDVGAGARALEIVRDLSAALPEHGQPRDKDLEDALAAHESKLAAQKSEFAEACRDLRDQHEVSLEALRARHQELEAQHKELSRGVEPVAEVKTLTTELATHTASLREQGASHSSELSDLRGAVKTLQAAVDTMSVNLSAAISEISATKASVSEARGGMAGIVGVFSHVYGAEGGAGTEFA